MPGKKLILNNLIHNDFIISPIKCSDFKGYVGDIESLFSLEEITAGNVVIVGNRKTFVNVTGKNGSEKDWQQTEYELDNRIHIKDTSELLSLYSTQLDQVVVQDEADKIFMNMTGNNDSMNDWAVYSRADMEGLHNGDTNYGEDVVHMNIPLLIRIFEYMHEDAKSDVEIHEIAERLTKLSIEKGSELTMEDYDSIIGEIDASEENLKNDTKSTVVIVMDKLDTAYALVDALNKFKKYAGAGGDAEMFIKASDEMKSCGTIGHDVSLGNIYHNVKKDADKKDEKKD